MPRSGTHEVGRRFELTLKQRQVMELMAQGRTNFEIAQALGLSLEGAKYHVSEILAKFDVGSREEAVAAWREYRSPAARAKRFLAGLPGLLPGPAIVKGPALALVAAGVVAIAWAAILALGGDSDVIDDPADITTPEQFLAAMEDRLSRDGQVLQVAMETTLDDDGDGTSERAWSNRAWLDLPRERARVEFEKDPGFEADISEAHTELHIGPDLYRRDPYDDEARKGDVTESAGCLEQQESLVEILICGGYPYSSAEPLRLEVNMGTSYEGKPAIAFEMSETVTPGDPSGGTKPPVVVTRTFYAEPDTFLPIAFAITTPPNSGVRGGLVTIYDAAFVDEDALPADLFDPAALGYRTPEEKEAALFANPRLGGEVYWLGRSFDPGAGLPALQGLSVEDWYHPERPVLIQLNYTSPDGSSVRIEQWNAGEWEHFLSQVARSYSWLDACGEIRAFEANGARVRLLGGWEYGRFPLFEQPVIVQEGQPLPTPTPTPTALVDCPTEPHNSWMAEVTFGDTVVTINGPIGLAGFGSPGSTPPPNAYNDPAALEVVARALRLHRAGE